MNSDKFSGRTDFLPVFLKSRRARFTNFAKGVPVFADPRWYRRLYYFVSKRKYPSNNVKMFCFFKMSRFDILSSVLKQKKNASKPAKSIDLTLTSRWSENNFQNTVFRPKGKN